MFDKATIERFESKVKVMPSGCHEWQGCRQKPGPANQLPYGVFHGNGKQMGAHRASYMIYVGPITDGLHVLHECDNASCVNPKHLKLGTPYDNTQDRVKRKGHTLNAKRHRISYPEATMIQFLIDLGYSNQAIANFLQVKPRAAYNVRRYGVLKQPQWYHLVSTHGYKRVDAGIFV